MSNADNSSSPNPAPSSSNLQATFKEMWATRPPRIPRNTGGNSKVAGVCEGIGIRYQIDPTLLRIIFVAAAFLTNVGFPAYFLAWAFMPRYGLNVSPAESIIRRRQTLTPAEASERKTGWILLVLFIITSGFGIFSFEANGFYFGPFNGTSAEIICGLALCVLAWFGLHQRLPKPPAGLLATPPVHTTDTGADLSGLQTPEGVANPNENATPPSWVPLGTAPFAGDLPEPDAATSKKRRLVWPWLVAAGVLVVGVVVLANASLNFWYRIDRGDVSVTIHHHVETEDDLKNTYDLGAGNSDIDLSKLRSLEKPHDITVNGGDGSATVTLPKDVPVTLKCDGGAGQMTCSEGDYNPGTTGERLTVTVKGGDGQMTVVTP